MNCLKSVCEQLSSADQGRSVLQGETCSPVSRWSSSLTNPGSKKLPGGFHHHWKPNCTKTRRRLFFYNPSASGQLSLAPPTASELNASSNGKKKLMFTCKTQIFNEEKLKCLSDGSHVFPVPLDHGRPGVLAEGASKVQVPGHELLLHVLQRPLVLHDLQRLPLALAHTNRSA